MVCFPSTRKTFCSKTILSQGRAMRRGVGIVMLGPDFTEVTGNEIRDNRSAGIALVSLHTYFSTRSTFDVGTEPEGNRIYNNTLVNNAYDPHPDAKKFGFPAVELI